MHYSRSTHKYLDYLQLSSFFSSPLPHNYEERVRSILEDTIIIIERIAQHLNDLFPQYGLTPSRVAPFPTIVRNLVNAVDEPDRLTTKTDMYNSLVENGIQSPQIVQAVLAIIGGGG